MSLKLPSELWLHVFDLGAISSTRPQPPSDKSSAFPFGGAISSTAATDVSFVSSFSRVNKLFRRLALPAMYKNLIFKNPNYYHYEHSGQRQSAVLRMIAACNKRIEILRTHHHLTRHVKRVDLLFWSYKVYLIDDDCSLAASKAFEALERFTETLPSLKTLKVYGCNVSQAFHHFTLNSKSLRALTLLKCWDGYLDPNPRPISDYIQPLIPLQELFIGPYRMGTDSMSTYMYRLLDACSATLWSFGLSIELRNDSTDDLFPIRLPRMVALKKLTLGIYSIRCPGPRFRQPLAEFLRSHTNIEALVFDTRQTIQEDLSGPFDAPWFREIVEDLTLLPTLRSFSGDVQYACHVVPGRPIQDILINSKTMFSPLDIPFTPFSSSRARVTRLHLDVADGITPEFAAKLTATAADLPNIEVLRCVSSAFYSDRKHWKVR